jgi:hypothetical protein
LPRERAQRLFAAIHTAESQAFRIPMNRRRSDATATRSRAASGQRHRRHAAAAAVA